MLLLGVIILISKLLTMAPSIFIRFVNCLLFVFADSDWIIIKLSSLIQILLYFADGWLDLVAAKAFVNTQLWFHAIWNRTVTNQPAISII